MSHSSDTDEIAAPSSITGRHRQLLSAQVRVDLGGLSDTGKVRPKNEDHFYVARFGRFLEGLITNMPEDEMPRRFEDTGYGVLVADGMGGHASGEVASKLAISTFINLVVGTPDWIMRLDDNLLPHEIKRRALERFGQIGAVMAEQALTDSALQGFGTTMTLAMSLGKSLFVAHIGDSRAYLLRQQRLYQLTRDHTMAQMLADQGRLEQKDVGSHRLRHVLTKSLGAHAGPVEPDVQEITLEDGDCLLMCSDGLTEMVDDKRIAQVLQNSESAEKACKALVEDALAAGGKDNVTVVVIRYIFPHSR